MSHGDGIVTERYTDAEISETLADLGAAGIVDTDDPETLERVAREFYFRGLVHGHADDAKVADVRADFGF